MKLSLSWLNKYVDINDYFDKPDALGALLTKAGLEYEGAENQRENYKNIVIGKIVELAKHPDADKLTICQVNTAEESLRQIVCGAKNHKQGDLVVVALPGAILPGEVKIKKSNIRGAESLGMLCSEKELGLSDESEGIMVLSEGRHRRYFPEVLLERLLGQKFPEALLEEQLWRYFPEVLLKRGDFSKVVNLDDVILEISVTPNRADCLSHVGLAREIACLLDRPLKFNDPKFPIINESTVATIKLIVNNEDLCPRYCGRMIKAVKVGPSPSWLKKRLEAVDINSINNIVDATNFVMLELGQPLHAFDLSEIKSRKIVIENSTPGEIFKTLDGTELKLTGQELMIKDNDRSLALAGVVGGLNSGVKASTTDLFIEAPYFSPKGVRQTARRFGIDTASSYRFSRGTDPEGVELAMNRACELITKYAGGQVAEDYYDYYPKPQRKKSITLDQKFIEKKLGYLVDAEIFKQWMVRIGCEVKYSDGKWTVVPPTFRGDLAIKEDLVEEYARLDGYDKIPEILPTLSVKPTPHSDDFLAFQRLQRLMLQQGYMQAINYHFINKDFQLKFLSNLENLNKLKLQATSEPVKIKNPLNEEVDSMRTSVLPGLMKNLIHNVRNGNHYGRLYELGACFKQQKGEYIQFDNLAFMAWGQPFGLWQSDQTRPVIFDLKTMVEGLLSTINIRSFEWQKPLQAPDFIHPGQWSALSCEGEVVGFVGSVHPKILKQNKIRTSVAVAEFDWSLIYKKQPRVELFTPLSSYPAVERDLAFVMPEEMSAFTVEKELKKVAGKLLKKIEVFDVYRGKGLEANEKSLSFKLIYQDDNETLQEQQLQQQKLIDTVSKNLSIRIR